MISFEELALNHEKHIHCVACGGCVLDPRVQEMAPVWCLGCMQRIEAHMPATAPRPWKGGVVFA